MAKNFKRVLRMGGFALAASGLLALAAAAQGQSQAPAKPAPAAPTHWGYYEPPPAPPPAAKPATKPEPSGKSTLQGAQTSGNQLQTTVDSTRGGGGGGAASSQVVSVPGINGGSKTLVDQDTQTVQVDANTTRTIKRTYGQGPDGQRQLVAVEQTDITTLGDGKSKEISTLTQRNLDGNFDLIRRTVGETVPAGPDSTRTNLTVFTPGMAGAMTPAQKIEKVQRTGKTETSATTTELVPDGNGGWMTSRKTATVVQQQEGGQQTEDKKIFAPDANGNLTLAQRQVTKDWKADDGQEHQEVSTYGPAPAGTLTQTGTNLVLTSRVTQVKATQADGVVKITEQSEQRSTTSTSGQMQVTGSVIEIDSPTKAGPVSVRRSVYANDGNGQLQQISVFGGEHPQPTQPAVTPENKAPGATSAKPGKAPAKKPGPGKDKPNS